LNIFLTKVEAAVYLGLDDKTFDNYFKNAAEFSCVDRAGGRGRFYFDKDALDNWLASFKWRTVDLTRDDYALCLDFALAQHFRGYVLSDWGTGRQREFGQKVTNWVKGQLAEVAVKKFFKNEFNVEVELDFDIHDNIVPQDIIAVMENGIKREPRIGIAIKSSKPKSAYLVLGENEVNLENRQSDVYIFCRPNIPDDHILRITKDKIIEIVKNEPLFSTYIDEIPGFEDIPCEIVTLPRVQYHPVLESCRCISILHRSHILQ
jgi:hypothetical protein